MGDLAPSMAMPETTVDKNYLSAAREHQVRLSRQQLATKTETVAHSMNKAPNDNLRGSIPASNPAHID
jgi:hypothetical protein